MRRTCPLCAVVCVVLVSPVRAQESHGAEETVIPVGPVTRLDQASAARDFWQVDVDASAMFGADGKQSGDLGLGRVEAGIAYNTTIADDLRLRVAFGTEQSWYDFDNVTTIAPGTDDPWDHLQAHRLGGALFGRINDRWSWFGGAEVRAAFESGADLGDSLEVRGTGGAVWTVDERLKLTFGVAVGTQIEDDALVIPVLGIDWRIDERTRLATRDLGLILSHEFVPHWSAGVFGAFEYRDWRLDDSRATVPGGVAREKRAVFGVEVRHRPSNGFEFAIEGGVVAWQKMKALDDDGRKVGEQEFNPAPYLGVSAIVRF